MEGKAPPLDAVALDPLVVADELHPPPPPPPPPSLASEDVLSSSTDGQAPPPEAVAPEPPTVADELPLLEVVEEEHVLPVATNAVSAASPEAPVDGAACGVVLTDELRDQIVKQVEYYFSDENLPTDEFMLKFVKKKDGFVPIGVIASFRRMKKLVQDHSIIEAALRTSSKLVVSSDGKRIKRLHPLPRTEWKDAKKSTVVVENLPTDFSLESIREKFGAVGKIVKISICDPHSVKESATPKKVDFILSSKIHALVEYEAVEAAEKAVTTLNDERNWRTGMKVRLLAKQSVKGSGKYNQSSKEGHDSVSERNNQNQPSKEEQNTTVEKSSSAVEGSTDKENMNSVPNPEDELQLQTSNSKGGRKDRYKGKGKTQIQQNAKGQGGSCSNSLNKPIPGPRMPDRTRGFTMGRGRPLPLQKSEKVEE